jgi:hypothetical protein
MYFVFSFNMVSEILKCHVNLFYVVCTMECFFPVGEEHTELLKWSAKYNIYEVMNVNFLENKGELA